jgi:hypothetical protein
MKWWEVVPTGATLVQCDGEEGFAVFESDNDGEMQRWTVDLWNDEVMS